MNINDNGDNNKSREVPLDENDAGNLDDISGEDGSASIGFGIEEFTNLENENADLKEKLMRVMADMENLRRRSERERQDAAKYAISNFAKDMLSVGDNMVRALQAVEGDVSALSKEAIANLIQGIEMTDREMVNIFERHGIRKLDPKGEKFNPNFHQAMFEFEDSKLPSGTVIEVVQTGYTIGDRVLRPAMVGVSKGGAKASSFEEVVGTKDIGEISENNNINYSDQKTFNKNDGKNIDENI